VTNGERRDTVALLAATALLARAMLTGEPARWVLILLAVTNVLTVGLLLSPSAERFFRWTRG
jgi:hypothetical protein